MADLLGGYRDRIVPKREYTKWTTYNGITRNICDLEDQHLCNIHYFMKFVNPNFYDKETKQLIANEIDLRFDGDILEYRPLRRLTGEIEVLREKGMIVEDDQTNETYVVFEGKIIGRVSDE